MKLKIKPLNDKALKYYLDAKNIVPSIKHPELEEITE